MTAIAAQIACPNIAPAVTPMGLFPAARAMVAICVRSPHSAINVNTKDFSKIDQTLFGWELFKSAFSTASCASSATSSVADTAILLAS